MSNRKSSNLRFLWIPGRKKHNKGHYDTTNKPSSSNSVSSHQPKRNEPWAMGGSKGHEELVKADISGEASSSGPANAMSTVIVPASCAVSASLPATVQNDSNLNGDQMVNGDVSIHPNVTNEYNAQTLVVGSKQNGAIKKAYLNQPDPSDDWYKKLPQIPCALPLEDLSSDHIISTLSHSCDDDLFKFQKDLDSIEKLDDDEDDGSANKTDKKTLVNNLPRIPNSLYRKGGDEADYGGGDKSDDSDDKDEKTVKCLYYALMCCECSIS